MFSGFMVPAWGAGTVVAVVAGLVGFFVVLRGSAFVAHAVPQGAFAGAAGANLVGLDPVLGLGLFSLLGALGIGWLGRRGRHDAVTALALVMMLGLGALFLSWSQEYEPEIFALLFGDILGVSRGELAPIAGLGALCLLAVAGGYRRLMLTSIAPEMAEARGVRPDRMEMYFLAVVALATAMAVPVVGALLIFSLMIGPPAAARTLTDRPVVAMGLSVVIALATIWISLAASYASNWPIGFFVGGLGALSYAAGRSWARWGRRGTQRQEEQSPTTSMR